MDAVFDAVADDAVFEASVFLVGSFPSAARFAWRAALEADTILAIDCYGIGVRGSNLKRGFAVIFADLLLVKGVGLEIRRLCVGSLGKFQSKNFLMTAGQPRLCGRKRLRSLS